MTMLPTVITPSVRLTLASARLLYLVEGVVLPPPEGSSPGSGLAIGLNPIRDGFCEAV
ncbi:hypothetical protein IG631_04690 [Alternaria alternata]|nr:hypothetical protein IG631_04690 [Alternaria alternata]